MKRFILLLSLVVIPAAVTIAEDPDIRAAFIATPSRDLDNVMRRAEKESKRVLVFVVDSGKKEGFHIKGTMGAAETKRLVKDNFLVAIVPNSKEKHVAGLVDDVNPMHPAYVLFKADGTVVEKGDAAMGAANGLEWVKKMIATP